MTVIYQFEGVHVQRSKEDIHTACFRCKGQLWMVCMHNRYWESRALWQFIVSAEDAEDFSGLVQDTSYVCKPYGWTASQVIRPFILSCRDTLKAETQAVCFKRWWQLCMICKELRIVLCVSHLVHKGRQLCSLLSTSYQSSGWFARPNIRLNCTCDSFSRFTKSPGQLMCPAGKATYSHFHSFLQRYFKGRNSSSML